MEHRFRPIKNALEPYGLLLITPVRNKLIFLVSHNHFMFTKLLTVALALCMGSACAQPSKGYSAASMATSHSPLLTKEVTAVKVSEYSGDPKGGNVNRRAEGTYVNADDASGHTGELLLATLILMGAIALKRSRSGKRDA